MGEMGAQPQEVPKPLERFLVRAEPQALNLVYGLLVSESKNCTIPIETMSRAEFEAIYERSMYWFWRDKDDVYALVNLAQIDPQSRQAEFGVVSIKRRGGFAEEACFALFRLAFLSMGLNRLWCRVNADNVACISLIEKVGVMTNEGRLRKARYKDGDFHDQLIFSILADEPEKWRRESWEQ